EDANTTARTKVADIVVTDDAMGTNTLSLTGADSGLFEIDGTELFLIAGASLDFETNPALDVTVRVDDNTVGGTPDDTTPLTIAITDVNELPTIQVTNVTATISQNVDTTSRVFVEEFVVSDVDAGPHNNNVTLVGADAGLFEIIGNRIYLISGASLDAGTNPVLDVSVQLDDPGLGAGAEATIDISIDVKDPNANPLPALPTSITGFVNENLWLTSRDGNGNYDTALASETPFPDGHIANSFQGDFNGDGREDIAFQMTNGEVYVGTSDNLGNFAFTLWTTLRMSGVKTLQVGDFNADGLTDLVGVYESAGAARLWVYESTGTSFISDEYGTYASYGDVQTVLVGNFDGVNGDDLAIMNSTGVWWVAKSDAAGTRFLYGTAWERWDATRTITDIQVGDFNGDGSDDILGVFTIPAVATQRSIVVGLSQGSEFDSSVWRRATVIGTLDAVVVGDFDNDDNDDFALLINQQDWMVGLADPANVRFGYASWGTSTYTGNAQNIGIGDTNGDGRADIFLRDAGSRWHAVESSGSSFATREIEQWSSTANWQHVKFGSFGPAPIAPSPDFESFGDAEFLDLLNGV
ncbi:FG-GAP-like repeat-containing protein, partial [Rubinisphaera margarita]|uniref:FG-GAP-like repeat-containing protein n=1 Tax=Rubinisphaera margarita TaxID=2909586 RepID=UPI001EE7C04C